MRVELDEFGKKLSLYTLLMRVHLSVNDIFGPHLGDLREYAINRTINRDGK